MSRKWLLVLLFSLIALASGSAWLFWDKILWAFNGFQAQDKDQLELWEQRRDLVWPALLAIAGGIWAFWRFVWSKAGDSEKTRSEQRSAELDYLNNLLRDYDLADVKKAYTHQSGDMQKHERMPERFFKAQLHYERHKTEDEPHQSNTPSEHQTDLLTAFAEHQWLVLLGEPGMGKTFSLWRIAAEHASHALSDPRKPIPVIVPLNEWIDSGQTLDAFILEQMQSLAPFHEPLCRNRRLLPLLDALNEIPVDQRDTKLPQVKDWIKRRQDYPSLLLTCRLRDYTLELIQNLDRLTIEPLTPPRIQEFLHNYFRHLFMHGTQATQSADKLFWQLGGGESMQQKWQDWKTHKPYWKTRLRHYFDSDYTQPNWDNFWIAEAPQGWYWKDYWSWGDVNRLEHLNNPRSLLKLAENPYLLSMMARIFHKKGQLPDSRCELFEEFVEVLLIREQEDKNRHQEDIPPTDKLKAKLKLLAWELQSQGSGIDEARTTLLRCDAEQLMLGAWIKFAHDQSVLIIIDDKVRFSHQLLQEFFTAQSFKERREEGWKASKIWLKDKWWEPNGWEVATELAFEYETDPISFLNWLAEGQPTLAVKIAREQQVSGADLFVSYREQWQSAITDITNYPNPHERHAISTVLAWLGWDNRFGIGLDANNLPDIDWVEIPEGEFIYQGNQKLTLDTFAISRYPITNAQFRAFVDDGGFDAEEWWVDLKKPEPDAQPEHNWTEANRPVENISWYSAMAFCRWLSASTGLGVHLPTEQQWEKAARGRGGLKYPWGQDYVSGSANTDETARYSDDKYKAGSLLIDETSAVGIYPQGASPYQVLDMLGNVWEWCLNKYEEPEMIKPDRSGHMRVLRGDSWFHLPHSQGSAYHDNDYPIARNNIYRGNDYPTARNNIQGIRVVCTPH